MRKVYLLLIAFTALFATISCSHKATLTLNLNGIEDGTNLFIADGADFDYEPVAEAIVKEGRATFKLNIEEPRAFRILAPGCYGGEVVAVGVKEKVTIDADAAIIPNETGKSQFYVSKFNVSGSPTHITYKANLPDRDAMDKEYEAYHVKHQELLDYISTIKRGTPEWAKMEESDEWKAYEADEKAFFNMVESSYTNAISGNSDNWMGPYFMLTLYSYLTTEENLPQYEAFTQEVKDSYYGKLVASKVVPMATDKPMPDFSFTDHATGKKMSLYDICKENKYVLIDFWASWCNPCRKEIPNFKDMYAKYHERGFQIVSISADSDSEAWLKALDEEKLQWPNDIDGKQGICKLYNVQFYPTVYLLDSNAQVIASNDEARGEYLREKLSELFDN